MQSNIKWSILQIEDSTYHAGMYRKKFIRDNLEEMSKIWYSQRRKKEKIIILKFDLNIHTIQILSMYSKYTQNKEAVEIKSILFSITFLHYYWNQHL